MASCIKFDEISPQTSYAINGLAEPPHSLDFPHLNGKAGFEQAMSYRSTSFSTTWNPARMDVAWGAGDGTDIINFAGLSGDFQRSTSIVIRQDDLPPADRTGC